MSGKHPWFIIETIAIVSLALCLPSTKSLANDLGNCGPVMEDFGIVGKSLGEKRLAIKLGDHWVPLRGREVYLDKKWQVLKGDLLQRNQVQFAYRINHRVNQRDQGVLVVKASNRKIIRTYKSPEEIDRTLPNAKVKLNRSHYTDTCEQPDRWDPRKKAIRVSYGNYVRYHKWDEVGMHPDFRKMRNFHFSYRKKTSNGVKCIRTDEIVSSSNRYRFLFDGTREVTFAQKLKRNLPVAGSAVAEPPVPKISVQMIRYSNLSKAPHCVFFGLSDLDDTTLIQINDLEKPSDIEFGNGRDEKND